MYVIRLLQRSAMDQVIEKTTRGHTFGKGPPARPGVHMGIDHIQNISPSHMWPIQVRHDSMDQADGFPHHTGHPVPVGLNPVGRFPFQHDFHVYIG